MYNGKFNAVTKGFQISSRKVGATRKARKSMKQIANRLARRSWFDARKRATEYCF